MKRTIYILAITLVMAIALGGVSVSADYEADNLTRGGTSPVFEAADTTPDTAESACADGETATDVDSTASTPEADSTAGAEDESDGMEYTEDGGTADGVVDTENAGDVTAPERSDGTPADTADGTTDGTAGAEDNTTDGAADAVDNTTDGAADTDVKNPFEVMFEAVKDYATEIFCSLSLACSLILAYCYKRGLIPLLSSGLNSLSGVVKSVKESTERGEGETRELSKIVTERLTEAENALDIITASVTDLGARLDELKEDKDEKAEMKIILGAQVDMLYSIFMTSALPQYQKDEVGARIASMRQALGIAPEAKGGAAVEGE